MDADPWVFPGMSRDGRCFFFSRGPSTKSSVQLPMPSDCQDCKIGEGAKNSTHLGFIFVPTLVSSQMSNEKKMLLVKGCIDLYRGLHPTQL